MTKRYQLINPESILSGNSEKFAGSTEIIPMPAENGNTQYIAVPSASALFSNPINVRETPHHLWLSPYDMYEVKSSVSLEDIIRGNIRKGDNVFDNENFKYKFDDHAKNVIRKMSKVSAFELDELLMFIVDFLESHEFVNIKRKNKFIHKKLETFELIELLENLSSVDNVDLIIETLTNASDDEVSMLFSAYGDAQISKYRKLLERN